MDDLARVVKERGPRIKKAIYQEEKVLLGEFALFAIVIRCNKIENELLQDSVTVLMLV